MKELHTQILFEYPFLSNVYESMLVTDNSKPDCPIVFANDQFEQMTLYPKVSSSLFYSILNYSYLLVDRIDHYR